MKTNKINFAILFSAGFFIFALVISFVFALDSIHKKEHFQYDSIFNNLKEIVAEKSQSVDQYVGLEKQKITTLLSDEFIQNKLIEEKNGFDDHKTALEELNKYLRDQFVLNEMVYEIFLLNNDGEVVSATNPERKAGEDFSEDILFIDGKKEFYFQEFFYDEEFNQKGIAISAPVINTDNGDVLGVLVIRESADDFYKIFETEKDQESNIDVFLVNKDFLLLTPSKFFNDKNKGILTQAVETEHAKNCFSMKKRGEHIGHGHEPVITSYYGENIIGWHDILPEINSCIIAEVRKKEVGIPIQEKVKKILIYSFIFILLLTMIGYFAGCYLDKKIFNIKREKIFDRKQLIVLFFAFIFVTAYFFVVTSFFQGWQNAAFYDEISDLFTVVALIILLDYSFRLKNRFAGKLVAIGSALAIVDKLIQIILEEYIFAFGVISSFYWVPGAIIGFVGLLLIFYGFKKIL